MKKVLRGKSESECLKENNDKDMISPSMISPLAMGAKDCYFKNYEKIKENENRNENGVRGENRANENG